MSGYIPPWLQSDNPAAISLHSFLQLHEVSVGDFRERPISTADFGIDQSIGFGEFTASKDSYLYSSLLRESLEALPFLNRVVDLGVGSAIPLISALLKSDPSVVAVGIDIDGKAIRTAQRNIELVGAEHRIDVRLDSIKAYLQTDGAYLAGRTLIGSNPPYLPCPPHLSSECTPVDGGLDGTLFLEQLLNHPFRPGQHLAVQWGSASNPTKMIQMIDQNYDVLNVMASEVNLGKYSSRPDINQYLIERRSDGVSAISEVVTGEQQRQLIIGTLLRRKN